MRRAVVIGGSGHVGTWLVPRLVEAGYEVVNISRGQRSAYQPHAAWRSVRTIELDRDAEDAAGTFAGRVVDLKPDIVILVTGANGYIGSAMVHCLNSSNSC